MASLKHLLQCLAEIGEQVKPTGGIGTTKAAHMQNRLYTIGTDGQIVRRSGVIAMNTRGGFATARASSARSGGLEGNRDTIGLRLHIKKLKSCEQGTEEWRNHGRVYYLAAQNTEPASIPGS